MVVDGHDEFNGSDERRARALVQAAAARPHLPLRIDARAAGPTVRLSIDLPAAPADGEPIDVLVALTEDDLTPSCGGARTAAARSRHVAVVRKLESLGTLEREAFVADGQLSIDRTWKAGKMRAVAWLQGRRTRHVYGDRGRGAATMTARA